uniref:Uncharacterized protein n=1 Tax=Avena sativa TaxID=4498 RepID=A0ACD5ZAD9_AVESA
MAVNQLSELHPNRRDWTVHVYVSRLWQHRGATDDGPIRHTDIVFQDSQGNHMYGEVTENLVKDFIDNIVEGKVYEIKRFLVCPKKDRYRPVEAQFMIRFGRYTTVRELPDNVMDYPLCTYSLTPIDDLPDPSDIPERFIDVVGIVTGVSPTSTYHSATRATPSTKRVIYLSNLSGHQIGLVLWGERATSFDGEAVLRAAEKGPVVILFVGTLVKPFESRRGLSGGAPCRWFVNEELPEITEIHTQLRDRVPAVQNISLPGQTTAEISAQVDLETKTVKELLDLNIWDNEETKFYCTAILTKLSPGERYWFSACTTCNRGTVPYGSAYKCSSAGCKGTGGATRYKICFVGADDTGAVEFVFFDRAGKELVGKAALTILRSKVPQGASIEEAVQFGRTDQSTPKELASIVSRKYRFVVSVTTKSFDAKSLEPSYQVHRIDKFYGKQSHSSVLRRKPSTAIASSTSCIGSGFGLAFVSADRSADGGLNSIGLALAEDAITDQARSSEAGVTGHDKSPAASTDEGVSGVDPGTTLLMTPPSVTKPPGSKCSKDAVSSSVQKKLFLESPPQDGSASKVELGSEGDTGETTVVTDGGDLLVPKDLRRRPLSQKLQGNVNSKKIKN